jgi:hypothetical protein
LADFPRWPQRKIQIAKFQAAAKFQATGAQRLRAANFLHGKTAPDGKSFIILGS